MSCSKSTTYLVLTVQEKVCGVCRVASVSTNLLFLALFQAQNKMCLTKYYSKFFNNYNYCDQPTSADISKSVHWIICTTTSMAYL